MKPPFAHLSRGVPATVAAAIAISLSVFLLPAAGVQIGPTPLLLSLGGAAGRVPAGLPAPARERASETVAKTASSVRLVATRTEHFVPQRRRAVTTVRPAHRRARTEAGRPAPSATVQVAAAAPAGTPATTPRVVITPPPNDGKALGHGRAPKPTAGAPAPNGQGQGHGKALGRANSGGNGPNGGGNGHKGGKK
jgi:hypothetical protein